MKYSNKKFVADKTVARSIMHKIDAFEQQYGINKQLSCTLITTFGLKKNIWLEDLIDNVITLDDLFKV